MAPASMQTTKCPVREQKGIERITYAPFCTFPWLTPGSPGEPSLGYQLEKGKKSAPTLPRVNSRSPLLPLGTGGKITSSGEHRMYTWVTSA